MRQRCLDSDVHDRQGVRTLVTNALNGTPTLHRRRHMRQTETGARSFLASPPTGLKSGHGLYSGRGRRRRPTTAPCAAPHPRSYPRPWNPSRADASEARAPRDEYDLLEIGDASLTPLERAQIRFIHRASLRPCLARQRHPRAAAQRGASGKGDSATATVRLRHIHGLDRLPHWDPKGSVILVANHRSFFDLYLTTALLVRSGLPHRILFPVRSTFFYDAPV